MSSRQSSGYRSASKANFCFLNYNKFGNSMFQVQKGLLDREFFLKLLIRVCSFHYTRNGTCQSSWGWMMFISRTLVRENRWSHSPLLVHTVPCKVACKLAASPCTRVSSVESVYSPWYWTHIKLLHVIFLAITCLFSFKPWYPIQDIGEYC